MIGSRKKSELLPFVATPQGRGFNLVSHDVENIGQGLTCHGIVSSTGCVLYNFVENFLERFIRRGAAGKTSLKEPKGKEIS